MILRNAQAEDQGELVKIYESFYAHEFPLNFQTAFASILAEQDSEILGFGYLSLTVEASILLNLNSRDRDKFEALTAIIDHGVRVAKTAKFDQLHIFAKDPKFRAILEKHYQFKPATGAMVRNL